MTHREVSALRRRVDALAPQHSLPPGRVPMEAVINWQDLVAMAQRGEMSEAAFTAAAEEHSAVATWTAGWLRRAAQNGLAQAERELARPSASPYWQRQKDECAAQLAALERSYPDDH